MDNFLLQAQTNEELALRRLRRLEQLQSLYMPRAISDSSRGRGTYHPTGRSFFESKLRNKAQYKSSSEYIKNKLGINTSEKLANFNNFFINLAIVESNNRNLPSSRGHNAAGFYQFLSNNGKAGGFIGSSLHSALNRLTTTYAKMNKKLPPRFKEIYKSKDVTKLSEADQKELVMADFYERKGTDPILKNIAAGDSESAFNLYRDIHLTSDGADQLTKRENNTQYEKVSELFKKNMKQLGAGGLTTAQGAGLGATPAQATGYRSKP